MLQRWSFLATNIIKPPNHHQCQTVLLLLQLSYPVHITMHNINSAVQSLLL